MVCHKAVGVLERDPKVLSDAFGIPAQTGDRAEHAVGAGRIGIHHCFGVPLDPTQSAGAARGNVSLGFVGDLLIDRDRPDDAYAPVRDLLAAPDVPFGNMEGPYSDNPRSVPSAGAARVPPAHNLDALGRAGFDVLSLANNHILDGGRQIMLENRRAGGRHLRRRREPRGSPRSRDP